MGVLPPTWAQSLLPMTAKEMLADLRSRLGSIAPQQLSTGEQGKEVSFTDLELMRWLNLGQMDVARKLLSIHKPWFLVLTSGNLNSSLYTIILPDDCQEIVYLAWSADGTVPARQCTEIPGNRWGVLTTNLNYAPNKNDNTFFSRHGVYARLWPIAEEDTSQYDLLYVRRPRNLDRYVKAAATSDGEADGTTIISTDLTQANGYWEGCIVEATSGDYAGEKRWVDTWLLSGNKITVEPAFSGQILDTTTFKIDDVSIVPAQFLDLVIVYAQIRAAMKAKLPFNELKNDYNAEFAMIRAAIESDVKVPLPGEVK